MYCFQKMQVCVYPSFHESNYFCSLMIPSLCYIITPTFFEVILYFAIHKTYAMHSEDQTVNYLHNVHVGNWHKILTTSCMTSSLYEQEQKYQISCILIIKIDSSLHHYPVSWKLKGKTTEKLQSTLLHLCAYIFNCVTGYCCFYWSSSL